MQTIRSFLLIFNYKTFVVAFLSVISTYLCAEYNLEAEFPLTLVSVAIVFPIVFSINSAYKRRESALREFATIKGHFAALYITARDWLGIENNPHHEKFKAEFDLTLRAIRNLFVNHQLPDKRLDRAVYLHFNRLSALIQELRTSGLNSSEISRANQYLSKIIIAFESMRNIAFYRTPITLRAYSTVFIFSFPIIYGPYFAYTFEKYESHLVYVLPVLFSFIMVSLSNIQTHLEHPFDEIGEDDIRFELDELKNIMHDQV